MKYILDRLKEPSSWRGLVMIATAFGVTLNPDLVSAIIAVGTGLAGVIGFVFKDKVAE
jgi:hypothetical protein